VVHDPRGVVSIVDVEQQRTFMPFGTAQVSLHMLAWIQPPHGPAD
jgi:hypothetical protein